MRQGRIAIFLLGIWLGVNLLVALYAAQSFEHAYDVMYSAPAAFQKLIQTTGTQSLRAILRHAAAEQNREVFDTWETMQLVLGCVLAGILFLGVKSRLLALGAVGMLLMVIFEHFMITPELNWLGRSIEFIPWTSDSAQRTQFWNLHTLYMTLDGAKVLLGFAVVGRLIFLKRRRRSTDDVELIDPPMARRRA